MKKNFQLDNGSGVTQGERFWEVSTVYDLISVAIYREKIIQVYMNPNIDHGKGLLPVVFNFENLIYVDLSKKIFSSSYHDTLSEIGYKKANDFDHDYIDYEMHFLETDHVFFRLYDDEYIRVHAERAEFYEVESLEGIGPILKPNGG